MEKKKKVFLAFSNAADQEDLIQVKYLLNQEGVEIVQFENGNYDKEQMLDCDYVFLITPRQYITNNEISVGRGQYDQLVFLKDKGLIGSDKKNMQPVTEKVGVFCYDKDQTQKGMFLAKVEKGRVDDIKDYKLKYGKILISPIVGSLQYSLKYMLDEIGTDTTRKSVGISSPNDSSKEKNIKDWLL